MTVLDEVVRRVRKESRVDASKIDEASTLDELGLSSLQVADIIFSLVDDFNVEIDEERAAQVNTLGELVAILDRALGHRAAATLADAQHT
jgi:acyl carrier protein